MRVFYNRRGEIGGWSGKWPSFLNPGNFVIAGNLLFWIFWIGLAPVWAVLLWKKAKKEPGWMFFIIISCIVWVGLLYWMIFGNAFEPAPKYYYHHS